MSAPEEKKKGEIDWSKIGFQVAICSVSHPVTQARVSSKNTAFVYSKL